MRSTDLRPEQIEQLHAAIGRRLRYLNRLVDRMTRLGFATDDPLWLEGLRARDAMQGLYVATHYAGIPHGVGRK